MEKHAHYFVAIKLSDQVKASLKEECVHLKSVLPFKRWVDERDLHITLAFLGADPDQRLNLLKQLLEKVIINHHSYQLEIEQLGIFGKHEAPRIFYADVKKENKLFELQRKVFSVCIEAGFELETRPFTPHITLARKWDGNFPFQLSSANNLFRNEPISFFVKEVVLYKTHMDRKPKYEELFIFSLLNE
ncbi:RNA 2',3'-cyclic phosphodiesterase [Bacillus sp. 03113]|uniref:RNA 2',3'-cyclic phosphodiesterase n=1 Tax=Bacillus sp. 03113 TaxID=2578211 RepID=UPI001144C721|nr:RNA 2',3'-cyclic phosphodiesterase [Bacillus sp. 03113]